MDGLHVHILFATVLLWYQKAFCFMQLVYLACEYVNSKLLEAKSGNLPKGALATESNVTPRAETLASGSTSTQCHICQKMHVWNNPTPHFTTSRHWKLALHMAQDYVNLASGPGSGVHPGIPRAAQDLCSTLNRLYADQRAIHGEEQLLWKIENKKRSDLAGKMEDIRHKMEELKGQRQRGFQLYRGQAQKLMALVAEASMADLGGVASKCREEQAWAVACGWTLARLEG